jgi:hypothetical protein
MAMCLSRPYFPMMPCHSAIERPYFFSMEGKYDAGPVFKPWRRLFPHCNSFEVAKSRRMEEVLDCIQSRTGRLLGIPTGPMAVGTEWGIGLVWGRKGQDDRASPR